MGPKVVSGRLIASRITSTAKVISSMVTLLLLVSTAMAASRKNVLILHEGSRLLPYQVLMAQEMQKSLISTANLKIDIFEEYLDNWRLNANISRSAIALDAKYAGKKIDLVVADGSGALQLVLDHPPDIFRDAPVVFVSVADFRLPPRLPHYVTGVTTHIDYAETIRLALALQPDLKNLYYIDSEPLPDPAKDEMLQSELRLAHDRLDIVLWERDTLEELLKKVNNLPPHSAVLFDTYFADPNGQTHVPAQICALIARNASVPVYTLYQTMVGFGPVGGVVVDFEGIGRQASRMILGILNGAKVSAFPVERSRNKVMIDWRAFEKFQLQQKQLPAATTVLYRATPVWVRYRWYFIIGGLIILIQLILIFKLAIEGKKRKESERSARELAGHLIHAQEQERRRIAGELHDDVSQRLALVCLQIDTMRESPPPTKEALVQELSVLYDETDLISSDIHQFSRELHPSVLEKLGLTSALNRYCSEFSTHRKIAVNLQVSGEEPPLNQETALALFRVGQECLTNVAKHSGATSCDVRLNYKHDRVMLDIEDQGIGYDSAYLKQKSGLGIESMRERLRSVSGELRIKSSPYHGTKVHAETPIKQVVRLESRDLAEQGQMNKSIA